MVDAASLEGFFKSLRHQAHRYPAFVLDGRTVYSGTDFHQVDQLIEAALTAHAGR